MRIVAILLLACAPLALSGCMYFSALSGGIGGSSAVAAAMVKAREQRGRAQDFSTTLLADGRQVRLSDYAGQPVVLNFWADWCPPCVGELPHFQEVYNEHRGQFVLLAVAVSSSNDAAGFVKANGYDFDMALDTSEAAKLYGVRGIPMTLFISRDGKIVDKVIGGMDKATFEEKLRLIL